MRASRSSQLSAEPLRVVQGIVIAACRKCRSNDLFLLSEKDYGGTHSGFLPLLEPLMFLTPCHLVPASLTTSFPSPSSVVPLRNSYCTTRIGTRVHSFIAWQLCILHWMGVHSYVHFIVAQVLSNLQTMSHLYCWQLKVTGFCLLFCRVWFGMACLTSIPLLRVVILYPWLCSFQQSQAFFLTIVWKYLWYTSQVTWLVGWLVSVFIQGKP